MAKDKTTLSVWLHENATIIDTKRVGFLLISAQMSWQVDPANEDDRSVAPTAYPVNALQSQKISPPVQDIESRVLKERVDIDDLDDDVYNNPAEFRKNMAKIFPKNKIFPKKKPKKTRGRHKSDKSETKQTIELRINDSEIAKEVLISAKAVSALTLPEKDKSWTILEDDTTAKTPEELFRSGQYAVLTITRVAPIHESDVETITLGIHSYQEWLRIKANLDTKHDYQVAQMFFGDEKALREAYGKDLNKVSVPQPLWRSIFIYSLALGITDGLWQFVSFLVTLLKSTSSISMLGGVFSSGIGACLWGAALTGLIDFGLRYAALWRQQNFMPTRGQTWALAKDSLWLMLKMFGSMVVYTVVFVGLRYLSAHTGFLSDIAIAAFTALACATVVTIIAAIAARQQGKSWSDIAWDSASLFLATFTASFSWTLISLFVPGGQLVASIMTAAVVTSSFIVWPAIFSGMASIFNSNKSAMKADKENSEWLTEDYTSKLIDDISPRPKIDFSGKVYQLSSEKGAKNSQIQHIAKRVNFKPS